MPDAARRAGGVHVRAASASDRGRVRASNEDRVYVDADRGIFAVVDGVGGHAAGEVAATIAVDVIAQRLARPLWSPEQRVREAIALANNEILTQASTSPERAGMTCVLTLALLSDQRLTIGHVGDTRLYRIDAHGMQKLTRDHSPVGEREDAQELTETEAMRHPRRNEVFRDVGSAFHEPGDPDFIDLRETPFDEQCALLLCSDGLTDMVNSAAIERIVRQHAGKPQAVAEALILAANEAGGRDNVSVVYVEGEAFARASGAGLAGAIEPAVPSAAVADPSKDLFAARGTWLAIGLVLGLAFGLALAWMLAADDAAGLDAPRILQVSQTAGSDYPTIAAAMAAATPRDTVQVEPGEYAEAVVVRDGVNLIARESGSVTLVAPAGATGAVALRAEGTLGSHISGLRVRGDATRPLEVGLSLAGHDLRVDDVSVEGVVSVGVDVVTDGTVAVRTSSFTSITGTPVRIGAAAHPIVERNTFVHTGTARLPALELATDSTPDIRSNVFVGYPDIVSAGSPQREQLIQQNLIAGTAPGPGRRGGR